MVYLFTQLRTVYLYAYSSEWSTNALTKSVNNVNSNTTPSHHQKRVYESGHRHMKTYLIYQHVCSLLIVLVVFSHGHWHKTIFGTVYLCTNNTEFLGSKE